MYQSRAAMLHLVFPDPTPRPSPPLSEPSASANYPMNCVLSPQASLADKLQILSMLRPHAYLVLEDLVDGLLAKTRLPS